MYLLAHRDGATTVGAVDVPSTSGEKAGDGPGLRPASRAVGVLAMAMAAAAAALCVGLIALDAIPGVPDSVHTVISGLPLALIALGYLAHQARTRPRPRGFERAQALLLCVAFLLWSGYQLLPNLPHVAILNDGAIALFTADVAVAILGSRRSSPPDLGHDGTGGHDGPRGQARDGVVDPGDSGD